MSASAPMAAIIIGIADSHVVYTALLKPTKMWANAQRDNRLAEDRWCPLFNGAKFG